MTAEVDRRNNSLDTRQKNSLDIRHQNSLDIEEQDILDIRKQEDNHQQFTISQAGQAILLSPGDTEEDILDR